MKRIALIFALIAPSLLAQNLDELLARVAKYDYGQSRAPLADFESAMRGALGSPEHLKEVEAGLVRLLGSGATPAARDFACRQLSLIGTAASVPTLAGMLGKPETVEIARYALERIPGPEVEEALRKALAASTGRTRVGIVNTLGVRGDVKAVPALIKLLDAGEPAAAFALARIATPEARKALARAVERPAGPVRAAAIDASLRCAEKLPAADAAAIYKRLYAPAETETVRVAALRGLARASSASAAPLIASALTAKEAKLRAAAVAVASPDVLAASFVKLPADTQVQAVTALAERRAPAARQVATSCLKGGDVSVKIAAIRALGDVGGKEDVIALAQFAAGAEGAELDAARESLGRMRGVDIDTAVVSGIRAQSGKTKVELIRAAGDRGTKEAAPALLESAQDAAAEVRRESLRALRETAGEADFGAVLSLLMGARSGSERREAERTLVAVARRCAAAPASQLTEAYRAAAEAESRGSVLMVIAQAGLEGGLPVMREALKAPDADLRRAAILAASEWPNAAPADDLIAVARGDASAAHQVLALRGYIRLLALPSKRSYAQSARMLGEAMGLAKQADEKKAILAAIQRTPCPEALAIAEAASADAEVQSEAKLAAGAIRRALAAGRKQ